MTRTDTPRSPSLPPTTDVAVVVGNPRPSSRTLQAAVLVARELAGRDPGLVVDLADLGTRLLAPTDPEVSRLVAEVGDADLVVVASPTYKATYTGLLKLFLDGYGPAPLAGTLAVPLMVGAAPQHALAVDVHLTPLLLELGARCPARGLYVLESELGDFSTRAATIAAGIL